MIKLHDVLRLTRDPHAASKRLDLVEKPVKRCRPGLDAPRRSQETSEARLHSQHDGTMTVQTQVDNRSQKRVHARCTTSTVDNGHTRDIHLCNRLSVL
jgi:hypothetical protein